MKRKVLLLSVATLFALSVVLVPPASAQVVDETVWLDTYSTHNGAAGPVYSSDVLSGLYTVTVQGTFSVWSPGLWGAVCPGSPQPENFPIYASTGTSTTGPVGSDADYLFAAVKSSPSICPGGVLDGTLPRHSTNLQFNFNGSWVHVEPDAPGYQATHEYVYTVTGTGDNTFGVQFLDSTTTDNYGMLKVDLHRWGQQVTGGGKINVTGSKKPAWTLAGSVGFDPASAGYVGQFQIVDHASRVSCHFNTFSNLAFSGDATVSPPSLYDTATFDASGTCNDGSTKNISVEITDFPEPSPDLVGVSGDIIIAPVPMDGGNFQVYVQP